MQIASNSRAQHKARKLKHEQEGEENSALDISA